MKNIFPIVTLFGLLIIGCTPMEDINKELDTIDDAKYIRDTFIYAREIAPASYTLIDDDYELSSNEDVANYKNFSADALPKDYLPEILNKKFTAANAAEMAVTYNYYSKPVVDEAAAYKISKAEYTEMGQKYIGFEDENAAEDLIGKLLDRKVYAADAGIEKTVEYNEYIKNLTRYIRVNADSTTEVLTEDPSGAYVFTEGDYTTVGQAFPNFTFIEDAQIGVVTLAGIKEHTLPKDYAVMVYRNFFPTYKVFIFNAINWEVKQSVIATTEPLNYALDKNDITQSTWWADPAIKITLTAADYNLYPETGKYQNFDIRDGQIPGDDEDKFIEMIGAMLDANHNAVDDQQYLVTYAYYDSGNGFATVRVIRTAGVWAEYSE